MELGTNGRADDYFYNTNATWIQHRRLDLVFVTLIAAVTAAAAVMCVRVRERIQKGKRNTVENLKYIDEIALNRTVSM